MHYQNSTHGRKFIAQTVIVKRSNRLYNYNSQTRFDNNY